MKKLNWFALILVLALAAAGVWELFKPDIVVKRQPAKVDHSIEKLQMSASIHYMNKDNVEALQAFLSGLKKSNPHISYKINKGRIAMISPRQIKATRRE